MELDFPIGLIADMMASYVLALTDLSSSSSIIFNYTRKSLFYSNDFGSIERDIEREENEVMIEHCFPIGLIADMMASYVLALADHSLPFLSVI